MDAASPSPLALGLAELAAEIRSGALRATDVVAASLARIAAVDGALHAFCTLDADTARAQAQAVDDRLARGDPVGPLAGVPVAIKDLFSTRGLRTTFGS